MDFHSRDNTYNGVILTRQYCAYNNMAFVSRNTRYNAGDLRIAIAHLVTRTLRRVIVHLVTPIPLAVITDITARYFVRWICAMS